MLHFFRRMFQSRHGFVHCRKLFLPRIAVAIIVIALITSVAVSSVYVTSLNSSKLAGSNQEQGTLFSTSAQVGTSTVGPSTTSIGQSSSISTSSNFSSTSSSSSTTFTTNADYSFFLAPNLARIIALREWFMTPFNASDQKAGYDPVFGMIRGGYWGGGFQNGFVLIDSNLILAKSLDYFNALDGESTDIEGNMMHWLSNTTFVDPTTGQTATYSGNDRREIMFGNLEQCVMDDSGQVFYAPGFTPGDPVQITTALPTSCDSGSTGSMNIYAIQIELTYLEGNTNLAQQMFEATMSGWTPTSGTGLGGSVGGYFNNSFDGGNCKSSRTLGYWLEMARATGFWSLDAQSKTMAQQVMNELWAHQLPDGSVSVDYPGCGNDNRASPESSGLALVAFDPRVPLWFKPAVPSP